MSAQGWLDGLHHRLIPYARSSGSGVGFIILWFVIGIDGGVVTMVVFRATGLKNTIRIYPSFDSVAAWRDGSAGPAIMQSRATPARLVVFPVPAIPSS